LADGFFFVIPSAPNYTFTPPVALVNVRCGVNERLEFASAEAPEFVPHAVFIRWTASVSPLIVGYNIYKSDAAGGPHTKINDGLVPATAYVDHKIIEGHTYFYVATAVNGYGVESSPSEEIAVSIPVPAVE
jgi:hypothetical protein